MLGSILKQTHLHFSFWLELEIPMVGEKFTQTLGILWQAPLSLLAYSSNSVFQEGCSQIACLHHQIFDTLRIRIGSKPSAAVTHAPHALFFCAHTGAFQSS